MKKVVNIFLVLILLLGLSQVSEAVPNYARNLNMSCSACHTVYPQLNATGKQFKENLGEALNQDNVGGLEISSNLFSGFIKLRPFDKRFSKDKTENLTEKDKQLKVRSFHESEIFFTGRTWKVFFFSELEAEDEWPDEGRPGFDVRLAHAYAGFHIRPEFNIFLGLTSPFIYDGNNTVVHNRVLRRQWNAANFVPNDVQMIGFAGRLGHPVTYMLSFHGDDGDMEGHDPRTVSGRLTYDFLDNTFGVYGTFGKHYDDETGRSEQEYKLFGADLRLNIRDFNVMLIWGVRDEDGQNDNYNYSLEVNRTLNKTTPIFNLDTFTKGESDDKWIQASFGVVHAFTDNIRMIGSFEGTIEAPDEYTEKEKRLAVMVNFGI